MPSHRHYATGDKSKDSTTKSGTSTESQNEDKTDLADADQPPKSPGILQRFKLAYKEYGKVLIGVHVATSVVWFGSFFYLAKRYSMSVAFVHFEYRLVTLSKVL